MIPRLGVLLLIIFFLLGAACTGKEPDPDPLPEGAEEINRPGFTVARPAGWAVRDPADHELAQNVLEMQPIGVGDGSPVAGIFTETGNPNAALGIREFAAAYTAQQRLMIPGYELLDSEEVDVPGARQAIRLTVEYDTDADGGAAYREVALLALAGDTEVAGIRAAVPAADFDDVADDFELILRSFRVDAEGMRDEDA